MVSPARQVTTQTSLGIPEDAAQSAVTAEPAAEGSAGKCCSFPKFYNPEYMIIGLSQNKDQSLCLLRSEADGFNHGSGLFKPLKAMSKKNSEFCNLRSPDFTTYLHPLPNYFDLNFLTNSFPNGMHFFFNEPICWVQIQKIQGVSGSRQKELPYLKEQKRTKAESRHGVQQTLVNEFGQLWPHFARSVQAME